MKMQLNQLEFKEPVPVKDHTGVHGWLLFLCITLTILRPLAAMAKHGARGEDIFHPNIPMAFDLSVAACSAYVGVCLWRIRPKAVFKVRIFLWLIVGLNALLSVLIVCSPGNYPDGREQSLMSCLGTCVWGTAWLAYLDSSKRVKATYNV